MIHMMATLELKMSDKKKVDYFDRVGVDILPKGYRNQVLTIFQRYPTKWFTPNMLGEGLGFHRTYALKICEALNYVRIIEKRKQGHSAYFRLRSEGESNDG